MAEKNEGVHYSGQFWIPPSKPNVQFPVAKDECIHDFFTISWEQRRTKTEPFSFLFLASHK